MRISEVTSVIARSWAESRLRDRCLAVWVLVEDRLDGLDSSQSIECGEICDP